MLAELFAKLAKADIRLWLDGEKLRFDAPAGALTPELRSELQALKAEVIAHLQQQNALAKEQVRTYPFSFAQQHFFSLQQLNPNDSFYTVPFAFRLTGELQLEVLQASVNAIAARHEILRTTLQSIDGQLLQVVQPTGEIAIKYVETSAEQVLAVISEELQQPFNLSSDSCLRVRLYRLTANEHILLLCLHILIYDQRSLNALLNEIGTHYNALLTGKAAELAPLPLQYGDYAKEQQALMTTPMQHRINYWQQWFARGEPQTWDWQTQATQRAADFEADILWQQFDADLAAQLRNLAQNNGVTLYMTLLAAYSVLLYRYTACPDIVLGTTFANRGRWQFDGLIGSTLSVLSLRISLHDAPDWLSLLKQLRDNVAQAMAFQDIPFRAMMPIAQPERKQLAPLFRSILSFLAETAHNELRLEALKVEFIESVANPASRPDLYLTVWEKRDTDNAGLTGYWLPQKNLFSDSESAAVMADFAQLLRLMLSNPSGSIAQAMAALDNQ